MCEAFNKAVEITASLTSTEIPLGDLTTPPLLSIVQSIVVENEKGNLIVGTFFDLWKTVQVNNLRWAYPTPELEAEYPELFV